MWKRRQKQSSGKDVQIIRSAFSSFLFSACLYLRLEDPLRRVESWAEVRIISDFIAQAPKDAATMRELRGDPKTTGKGKKRNECSMLFRSLALAIASLGETRS